MSDRLGYARISTTEQDPALQHDALTAAGCIKVFTDKGSGAVERRPQLDRLLDQLRPGDTLVVWRLDRLARSTKHLLQLADGLNDRDVHLVSLTEGFDTSTPGGRLLFTVLAAVAEMERSLIVERTRAGLNAARARGRKGGRPSVMTEDRTRVARQMYDAGEHTLQQIANTIGVSRSSVVRALAKEAA